MFQKLLINTGILAKVRESAENMQHKIQSVRTDGLGVKFSDKGMTKTD